MNIHTAFFCILLIASGHISPPNPSRTPPSHSRGETFSIYTNPDHHVCRSNANPQKQSNLLVSLLLLSFLAPPLHAKTNIWWHTQCGNIKQTTHYNKHIKISNLLWSLCGFIVFDWNCFRSSSEIVGCKQIMAWLGVTFLAKYPACWAQRKIFVNVNGQYAVYLVVSFWSTVKVTKGLRKSI